MMKYFARFLMRLGGWKYVGHLPEVKKAVIISVPHTSNWDFVWGELAFLSQGIPAYILMKKEFFFFPLGAILRALRVIPVDRGNKESHLVDQMVQEYNSRDTMYLCITPEGSLCRFIWGGLTIKPRLAKSVLCFIRLKTRMPTWLTS